MPNPSNNVQAIVDPRSVAAQMRALREDFKNHSTQDREEFAAIRGEQIKVADELKLQIASAAAKQDHISADVKVILNALGLGGAGEHRHDAKRRRKRPAALMGGWELVWKIGGATGGLMLIWKMLFAAAPSAWSILIDLGHALQAINHVATQ